MDNILVLESSTPRAGFEGISKQELYRPQSEIQKNRIYYMVECMDILIGERSVTLSLSQR